MRRRYDPLKGWEVYVWQLMKRHHNVSDDGLAVMLLLLTGQGLQSRTTPVASDD